MSDQISDSAQKQPRDEARRPDRDEAPERDAREPTDAQAVDRAALTLLSEVERDASVTAALHRMQRRSAPMRRLVAKLKREVDSALD